MITLKHRQLTERGAPHGSLLSYVLSTVWANLFSMEIHGDRFTLFLFAFLSFETIKELSVAIPLNVPPNKCFHFLLFIANTALFLVKGFLLCASYSAVFPVLFIVAVNFPLFSGFICIPPPFLNNASYFLLAALTAVFPIELPENVVSLFISSPACSILFLTL